MKKAGKSVPVEEAHAQNNTAPPYQYARERYYRLWYTIPCDLRTHTKQHAHRITDTQRYGTTGCGIPFRMTCTQTPNNTCTAIPTHKGTVVQDVAYHPVSLINIKGGYSWAITSPVTKLMPTTSCSLPQTSEIMVLAMAIRPFIAPSRNLLRPND